jgi:SAM-dependent methyltransferase
MTEARVPVVDTSVPNMARMYDYALGGKDNFAADREAVEKLFSMSPENKYVPLANRRFLGRAVRFVAEQGIDQYLDLGAGLPSQGNVHEVADLVRPGARVVYVDNDPVVTTHARALLALGHPTVAVVEEDVRFPDRILGNAEVQRLIDFTRPVAVLFVSLLHGITDAEDPAGIVRAFAERMAPGSYVIISHLTREGHAPEAIRAKEEVFARSNTVFRYRGWDEILGCFDGFDLVEPGLTPVTAWRGAGSEPELEAAGAWWLGGVAIKR